MIDIADLAVGQSRMLYGRTMHSERTQHRMYEQWHPLGVIGIISASTSRGGLVVECAAGSHLRQCCIWKPSPKTPLCALAFSTCANASSKHNRRRRYFSCCW